MNLIIKPLEIEEMDDIKNLLLENRLPVSDITENNIHFFTANLYGQVIAVIGLEKHGEFGLLRSLAVKEEFRNHKIAEALISSLMDQSQKDNLSEVYLLTTTADRYFEKHGFKRVERIEVPQDIMATSEFKSICPSSAVVMKKGIKKSCCTKL